MLLKTTPAARIVVDASAQDTGHRTRGIGRYASCLWEAIRELDDSVVALRLTDAERSWNAELPDRVLPRFIRSHTGLGSELSRAGCRVFGATEPWTFPRGARNFAVVPTCHDVIPLEFASEYSGYDNWKWKIYFEWLRKTHAFQRCPRVIVPSAATRDQLAHYIGVDPDHVTVVHHGIDHRRFFPPTDGEVDDLRARLGIGSEPYVLYVGGYDFRKNIPTLVEGFAASGRTEELLLVLAGGASVHEYAAVAEASDRCGVTARVVWTGRVADEDLNALYGGAEAFMYPSLSEGFGLQLLEAMACGCPIITSNRSSLSEVAGEAAVLVDPESPDAIGAALAQLTSDLQQEYRDRGLARAAKFTWAQTARQTLDVYESAATA